MGKDMGGEAFRQRTYEILGEYHYWGEGLYFVFHIFLVLKFGWIVKGVHHVAGSFGLGGQESSWNPRARESDRLCS